MSMEVALPDLALFDFDGTITKTETFTPFIRFTVPRVRFKLVAAFLSPVIAAYRLDLLTALTVRKIVINFCFYRMREADLLRLGREYSTDFLPKFLRPLALERIAWHKDRGDTVVVVSASLSAYLSDWCRSLNIGLICSELETSNGFLTGRYKGGDCAGEGKSNRIRERYNMGSFSKVYAYGDTYEDYHMLELAHYRFFRWQELSHSSSLRKMASSPSFYRSRRYRKIQAAKENRNLKKLVANQSSGR